MSKKTRKTTKQTATKAASRKAAPAATKRPASKTDAENGRIALALESIAASLNASAAKPSNADSLKGADAFVWHAAGHELAPVAKVNRVALSLLRGVDRVRDTLAENTERFAKGLPANNALLWGCLLYTPKACPPTTRCSGARAAWASRRW